MPKVSFLVTYYNQQKYVGQSLDSIFAIRFPNNCEYEILVGDDGSSDNTLTEVQKYADKYPGVIRVFTMPRQSGVKYNPIKRASANRLNLLSHVSGDYYCILDGDDWYCDFEFISEGITKLEAEKTLSVCAFGFQYVTDGICEKCESNMHQGTISAEEYLLRAYTHAGACLLRNVYSPEYIEIMKSLGYFDDNNIVIANLNFGDLFFIDRVIYSYRQTGKSIWTSISLFEQKVINAFDYDINIKYGSKYPNEIKQRHFGALRHVYIRRKSFLRLLGKEKAEKYLSMAELLPDSMFMKLIRFDHLTIQEKKNTKRFIYVPITRRIRNIGVRIYRKILRKNNS